MARVLIGVQADRRIRHRPTLHMRASDQKRTDSCRWPDAAKGIVGRGAASVLGALLAWAGVAKLVDAERFVEVIERSGLVRASFVDVAASGVIVVEVLLGLSLVCDWRRRLAAVAASAMLVGFTFVAALALDGAGGVECRCFGGAARTSVGWILARNGALVALGILAAVPRGAQPRMTNLNSEEAWTSCESNS